MASPHPCDHGMLSPPSTPPFLHLHAKFKSCLLNLMPLAQYLPSALSKATTCFLFVLRTIVVYSYLERCPCFLRTCSCGWASFFVPIRPRWWASCSAQFGTYEFGSFYFLRLSSGITSDDNCTSSDASGLGFQCKGMLCTDVFFFPSCVIHFVHGSGREICLLVHVEFCVKTLHVVTVSVCLVLLSC